MILLRPAYQAGVNRFIKGSNLRQTLFRDGTVVFLGMMILWGGYLGTQWILTQLEQLFSIAYLSPTTPLYLVFLILFGLLTISNIVSMSGSFYQSEDMDLILASPLSRVQIFIQRFLLTTLATSAISLLFIMPILIAYAVRFSVGGQFIVLAFSALIPFFLIPAAIGFIGATALAWLERLRRSKIFFICFLLLFMFGILKGVDVIRLIITSRQNVQDFSQLTRIFTVANLTFAPSTWVVEVLDALLALSQVNILPRYGMLWGAALFMVGGCIALFQKGYMDAYSASKSLGSRKLYKSLRIPVLTKLLPPVLRQMTAVMKRDTLMLTRDVAQVFQVVLLLGIFGIYIYNLRLFSALSIAGPDDVWWKNFLFISNFCMSAFVALAMCTRFVFPSISVDGRAYVTYIVKAPLTMKRFIQGKFIFWCIIVGSCHLLISGLGMFASGAHLKLVVVSGLLSLFTSVGLVGLAVGLGAIFSRFDWEHLSQLAVGYGNIIFMLVSAGWIFLCLIPSWFVIVQMHIGRIYPSFYVSWIALIVANSLLAINVLRRGIKKLEKLQV